MSTFITAPGPAGSTKLLLLIHQPEIHMTSTASIWPCPMTGLTLSYRSPGMIPIIPTLVLSTFTTGPGTHGINNRRSQLQIMQIINTSVGTLVCRVMLALLLCHLLEMAFTCTPGPRAIGATKLSLCFLQALAGDSSLRMGPPSW